MFGLVAQLADATGVGESALKLLIGLLLNYPLAIAFRMVPGDNIMLKHLVCALGGMGVGFFCFGFDVLHSLASIILTWLVLLSIPNRRVSLTVTFLGNMAYLLYAYHHVSSSESYDIDWTTPQCVLVLRLIGFAFDYYDGAKPEKERTSEEKVFNLQKLPGILETLGYCYFFPAFIAGPQFPYYRYNKLITGKLFNKKESPAEAEKAQIAEKVAAAEKLAEKSSTSGAVKNTSQVAAAAAADEPQPPCGPAVLKCFGQSLLFLALTTVISAHFPSTGLREPLTFSTLSFFDKLIYMVMSMQGCLLKYFGVWLMSEGACILVGIGFGGYTPEGVPKWDGASNIHPWACELATNHQQIIDSFNINTNDWVKRYIFKRLRFANNRNFSSFSTLFFLAVWHGFAPGYFICFMLEFMYMEAERRYSTMTKPFYERISGNVVLRNAYCVFCWCCRMLAMHYAYMPFELKTWSASMFVFQQFYFFGHIGSILLVLAYMIFPPPRPKSKPQ